MPAGRPKGQPKSGGRAKGTLNHNTADIKALALKHAPDCVAGLAALTKDRNSGVRLAAYRELLDRGVGKAAQPQTGEGGEGPARIEYIFNWQK